MPARNLWSEQPLALDLRKCHNWVGNPGRPPSVIPRGSANKPQEHLMRAQASSPDLLHIFVFVIPYSREYLKTIHVNGSNNSEVGEILLAPLK